MKVAVCYRGYLRTISKVFENQVSHLFKNHDVDFFCHTWDEYPEQVKFLTDIIKPKRLMIEQCKTFEKNPYNSITANETCFKTNYSKQKFLRDGYLENKPYNTLSMLYSLQKVNGLRKEYSLQNNISYDCVISIRPDLFFYDDFDLNSIELSKINISWFHRKGDHLNNSNAIIDHIAVSNEENIDFYSDCFLYVPSYYFNQKIPMVPEILLGWHIKSNSIETQMVDVVHFVERAEGYTSYISDIDK